VRRRPRIVRVAMLAAVGSALAADPLAAQEPEEAKPFCCDEKHIGTAAAELAALEFLPWYYNRYFSDDSTAVLSLDSWWRNIEQGFEWDVNDFRTNMFWHPLHGSTYFNVARSNGYAFWEAAACPWIGSFLFEFLGENNRPSINDWVATSASGVVIGEALHRASRLLLDNRARGAARAWRELTAFLVNPVGGINRLFRGEMTRVGPNPDDRFPASFHYTGKLGFRAVGNGNLNIENDGPNAFAEFRVQYGDPVGPLNQPFDDFVITAQLNSKDADVVGLLQVEGSLHRAELTRSEKTTRQLSLTLHYDYIHNETYEMGGHSVGIGLTSAFLLSEAWSIRTKVQLLGSMIAAVGSEYADVTGRNYDYGSGAGLRIYGTLLHAGYPLIEAFYVTHWVHSLNGASGEHVIHFPSLAAQVPLTGRLGAGIQFIFAARNSYYRDFDDVHRRNPQFRAYVTMTPSR